jgi:hypothetical protein
MPCNDGGVPYPPTREEVLNDKVPVPMLCALLTVLKQDGQLEAYLNDIDWKEAGITEDEFLEWWTNHKRRDQQRKAREEERRRAKLTYYVHRPEGNLVELRQTRFKATFKGGKGPEHPHDICAYARDVTELRNMLVSVKIDPDTVDWS